MTPRYQKRLIIQSRAVFTFESQGADGRLLNFNGTGGLIESSVQVYRGAYVALKLFLPHLLSPLLVTLAAVRWAHGSQFGVEFIQIPEKEQQVMKQFLARYPVYLAAERRTEGRFSESNGQNWHLNSFHLAA
jgi:PilZ domain